MPGPPGRDPRSARSNERQSFAGHGTRTTVEKDGIGLFIDDAVYAFADVSISCLPVLAADYRRDTDATRSTVSSLRVGTACSATSTIISVRFTLSAT